VKYVRCEKATGGWTYADYCDSNSTTTNEWSTWISMSELRENYRCRPNFIQPMPQPKTLDEIILFDSLDFRKEKTIYKI